MARRIRWLSVSEVHAFHDLQLAEHGGLPGLRDAGLLESAVLRPQNAYEYGTTDLAELAAKLAFGLISNHPFFDGNKRTALVASVVFLRLNGKGFAASEHEAAVVMIDTAARNISEEQLVRWYHQSARNGVKIG
jgi:death-on-curing protein